MTSLALRVVSGASTSCPGPAASAPVPSPSPSPSPLPCTRPLYSRLTSSRVPRRSTNALRATASNGAGAESSSPSPVATEAPAERISEEMELEKGLLTDSPQDSTTSFVAETLLPTRSGKFRVRAYRHSVAGVTTEPSAMINGIVEGQENVPVRVHDACFTSEVLGSMKCDCAEQLHLALDYIQNNGPGIVIYLQQEGRGIGLANKIAAYALQEKGLDTVDANRALGLPDDCREYTSVLNILDDLDVKSIQLMTNNPRKVNSLACMGIKITKRIPCIVTGNEVNQGYLDAKQQRMDHDLDTESNKDLLDGSWCYWDHSGDSIPPPPSS